MHPHPPHGWTWAKLLLQSNLLSGTVTVLGEGVYIYIYIIYSFVYDVGTGHVNVLDIPKDQDADVYRVGDES